MSTCPLFTPNVETVGIVDKANCGTCRHWDPERQRCSEEGKFKQT